MPSLLAHLMRPQWHMCFCNADAAKRLARQHHLYMQLQLCIEALQTLCQTVLMWAQDMGPNNWFYINVMLDHSELFIPLPEQSSEDVSHALNSKLRGVALRWDQLRVGYFFGGDGEKILRVNAHDLSMIGRLPEVVHSQVDMLHNMPLLAAHQNDCVPSFCTAKQAAPRPAGAQCIF